MRCTACGYTAPEKPIRASVLNQLRHVSQPGTATFSGASAAIHAVTLAMCAGVGDAATSSPVNPTISITPCTRSVQATARMPPTVS